MFASTSVRSRRGCWIVIRSFGADWWVRLKANQGAAVRLFCFPCAGANASFFQSWPSGLPGLVEMFSLQLPGRANRILETPQSHLPTLVQAIGEAILPLLDRPALFFGHSLGAILSFELARWLRRRYKLPARLVVSGRCAPHLRARRCGRPRGPC